MKTTALSLVIVLAPAALLAQAGARTAEKGGGAVSAGAAMKAGAEFRAPSSFSAEGQAKLNAMYSEAKEHHVPREPMAKRVDEGRAKGASEAAIVASAGRVKANLEASQEAMVAAGRAHPSDEECERGASAMERGVTKAQIRAIAKSSPRDRSLVVAFDVLARLAARGVPVTRAVAQVQANVTSGASDAALTALVNSAANAHGANAAVSGTAAATSKPLTGTVAGAVGGVVKKP